MAEVESGTVDPKLATFFEKKDPIHPINQQDSLSLGFGLRSDFDSDLFEDQEKYICKKTCKLSTQFCPSKKMVSYFTFAFNMDNRKRIIVNSESSPMGQKIIVS